LVVSRVLTINCRIGLDIDDSAPILDDVACVSAALTSVNSSVCLSRR
jgi:hypothetical protein